MKIVMNAEDRDIVIFEHIRDDGRLDLEELEVSYRKGIVYLEGVVPSEGEHQILLKILTDVMGFTSIIDHLQTSETVWEREDRAPGKLAPGISERESLVYDTDEVTDDVIESLEKEISYIFPDRPQPDESED